jgi:hypothetical protein
MDRLHLAATLVVAGLAGGTVGCTPHIGDHCTLNTDCSITGTLFCDTSQPNGYCTFFNCAPNTCQDNAVCVLLNSAVPGCSYDDYNSPARTGRSMCLKSCQVNSDCRSSEGYVCADLQDPFWKAHALIIDSNQSQHVCMVAPDYDAGPIASYVDAAVCQATGPAVPPIEAGVNLEEAGGGEADAGGDSALDAGSEAGLDAGLDAEAGPGDATLDAPQAPDAPDGD